MTAEEITALCDEYCIEGGGSLAWEDQSVGVWYQCQDGQTAGYLPTYITTPDVRPIWVCQEEGRVPTFSATNELLGLGIGSTVSITGCDTYGTTAERYCTVAVVGDDWYTCNATLYRLGSIQYVPEPGLIGLLAGLVLLAWLKR